VRPALLFAVCAAFNAGILSGCSELRFTSAGGSGASSAPTALSSATQPTKAQTTAQAEPQPATPVDRKQPQLAKSALNSLFAKIALNDGELSGIRGGLNTGSGVVVNFSFQQATFVNHALTQTIVLPTITISPGSSTVAGAGVSSGPVQTGSFMPNTVALSGNATIQLPVNPPTTTVQTIINNGLTSIVSDVGANGVANVIGNRANNQLIQQVTNANIDISGLSRAIQQGVTSTVLGRVQAATAQFR